MLVVASIAACPVQGDRLQAKPKVDSDRFYASVTTKPKTVAGGHAQVLWGIRFTSRSAAPAAPKIAPAIQRASARAATT
jgi:hypothetical protein